ncbi:hypothetical protein EVAR_12280_1 [Eumeta japonica]|uniref:Uncharacterized protein n=1 Tax=Eumeta variegata TaxID=151549 RepID=A0A4C1TU99_EUMVA|nr:hypothetical protein EVAR_12280_1 [Eumeta japonica]
MYLEQQQANFRTSSIENHRDEVAGCIKQVSFVDVVKITGLRNENASLGARAPIEPHESPWERSHDEPRARAPGSGPTAPGTEPRPAARAFAGTFTRAGRHPSRALDVAFFSEKLHSPMQLFDFYR